MFYSVTAYMKINKLCKQRLWFPVKCQNISYWALRKYNVNEIAKALLYSSQANDARLFEFSFRSS